MKIRRPLILVVILLLLGYSFNTCAKVITGYMNNYLFYDNTGSGYVETVIALSGASLHYVSKGPNAYQSKAEITLIYWKDSTIVKNEKYILSSPILSDTLQVSDLIDLKRVALPFGKYKVELQITDVNAAKHFRRDITQNITIETCQDVCASDIEFVDNYAPSTQNTVFTKNGYSIVPRPVNAVYPADSFLTFYTEFYHLLNKENTTVTFILSVKHAIDNTPVEGFTTYHRQKSAEINILLDGLNIKTLPGGYYMFSIDAYDSKGTVIKNKSVFFERMADKSLSKKDAPFLKMPSYISEIPGDSLNYYLSAVFYYAANGENNTIQSCIDGDNLLAKRICIRDYWYPDVFQLDSVAAKKQFYDFKDRMHYVEHLYSTNRKPGYRTDQGRVYLKYGAPDYLEKHPHDVGMYPYEIWQYYKMDNGQTNVSFIFYNRELVSGNYTLIHSDRTGEIKNSNWQQIITQNNKTNQTGTTIDQSQYGTSPNFNH